MSLPDPVPVDSANSSERQCIVCNQPNEADRKMVQCDGCERWYHFMCVGVNDSIEDENRSFLCMACAIPDPPGSVASTSTSAREARLQLEMQRLAEEKLLQKKMQEEREKQDRELQEMALRLERERRDKAIVAMFALEKEYIKRKYNLLHTQLDEDGDAASVRSRRDCSQGTSKVQEWITRNPAVTLSANTGSIPTGLTLHTETTSSSVQMTSATTTTVAATSMMQTTTASVASVSAIPSIVTSSSTIPLVNSSASTTSQQVIVQPLSAVQQPLHPPPTSTTMMQWNQSRPIPTPLVSAQQNMTLPSTTNDPNNMFMISPTTTTSVSYPLPSEQPVVSIPSHMQYPATLPSTSYQPLQSQVPSSSAWPIPLQPPMVSSSSVPVYVQSGAAPSIWQQPSYFMPPPSHHSTPTSIPLGGQPGARHVGNTTRRPVIAGMQTSASIHNGQYVTANPVVGQYVPLTTAVSNRYCVPDLRDSNPNFVQNPWVSVYDYIPPSSVAQQGNFSNHLPVSCSDGNWGQNRNSGYQGNENNQPGVPYIQPVPTVARMVANNPRGTNSYNIPVSNVPQLPPAPPEMNRGPNAHQLAARHVVPRDLPSFGGNPAEWPLLWSSYETSTQMCGYTEAENLLRLQRCLKGEAKKAVSSFLLHPSNVGEIVSTLRMLYGRPDAIIGTLLNDVRSTPTPKPEKLETLVNFGLVVRNLCAHLVSAGQEMHLANPILLQELVDKLPANIKLGWAMHKQSVAVADLRSFADYMNVIINAASRKECSKPER